MIPPEILEGYKEKLKLAQNCAHINENTSVPLSADDVSLVNKTRGAPPEGKSRLWIMLLYPDNEEHAEILQTVFNDFVCIGACHDSDVSAKDGKPLKEHYHIVFYFPSAVYASHILSHYPKLDPRFLAIRKEVKVQVRYLLHLDTPSKFQYPINYLEGHVEKFRKYIDGQQLECDEVLRILDWIEKVQPENLADLLRFVCAENLYATYRRNAYTFNTILTQTANFVKRKD